MLVMPKDRYCPTHEGVLGKLCNAQPCTRTAIGNTKACGLPDHQKAMRARAEKTVRSRTAMAFVQRSGAKLPEDATAALNADTDSFDVEDLVDRDETDRAHEAGRDGEDATQSGTSKKIITSNARTHNDILFGGTCGIIQARETMFRAESVVLVRVSFNLFCVSFV